MLFWIESCRDICILEKKVLMLYLITPIEKKGMNIYFFVSMTNLYCKVALCHESPRCFVCFIQAPTRFKGTYILLCMAVLCVSES